MCSDIIIEGDDDAQKAVRFAAYHLISAANPEDERVSIGARALTGDSISATSLGYRGLPAAVLHTHLAGAARSLLMYRYHTLPGAREGEENGLPGRDVRLESADTGEETTPEHIIDMNGRPIEVLCGKQEQHISADIAWAVWQYWRATGDEPFLLEAGAEILLETARFGRAARSLARTRLFIFAVSSGRTNITSISMTTPLPMSWRSGTSSAAWTSPP